MMVNDMTAHSPELAGPVTQTSPNEAAPGIIAPETARAAAASMTQPTRGVTQNRTAGVSHKGSTLEDLLREEIRPMLKDWLDTHPPPMVERLVQAELERLTALT